MAVTGTSATQGATPDNPGFGGPAGRALVPVGAGPHAAPERHMWRSKAAGSLSARFLAHLIATREDVPQARSRRRATADEACLRYDAVDAIADDRSPTVVRLI